MLKDANMLPGASDDRQLRLPEYDVSHGCIVLVCPWPKATCDMTATELPFPISSTDSATGAELFGHDSVPPDQVTYLGPASVTVDCGTIKAGKESRKYMEI